jgi:hypothetical protein
LAPEVAIKAASEPRTLGPADVLQLQRAIGNRAAGVLLDSAQPTHRYHSGLPSALQANVEDLSGVGLDDVRVHYNSPEPARMLAAAYTRGTDIHLAPGQQRELAHEAWHVVQQQRGDVRPTGRARGLPISDSPALEREADAMGSRAAQLGTRSARRPSAARPRPVRQRQPVLQARWLVDPETREFFWEEEKGVSDPGEPPSWLADLRRIKPLEPGKYAVDKGRRGTRLVYSLETYKAVFKPSSGRAPSDVYNPFGRFASTAVSSFVPNPRLAEDLREAVTKSLIEKDTTYKKPTGVPPKVETTATGYPKQISVEGGQILGFVEENDFGAVYALDAPTARTATYDPTKAKDVSELALVGKSTDVKIGQNPQILPLDIEAWSGEKRSIDQGQVMGASAGDAAENAGFVRNEGEGWEWLHMIAHSMGGLEVQGPQVEGNLVAGTGECNSQMIVVEEFIKDVVKKSKGRAALWVAVRMFDPVRHIGGEITYDFELYNEAKQPVAVYHWSFNPLSRRQPVVMENRSARYVARELYEGGATAATTHTPRSQPTTHGPLVLAADDPITKVVNEAMEAFRTLSPAEFVKGLVVARQTRGSLPKDVFTELGEQVKPEQLAEYLGLLLQHYPRPQAVTHVVYSFLFRYHSPNDVEQVTKIVVTLFGSEAAVPEDLKRIIMSRQSQGPKPGGDANQPTAMNI